jgi:ABC-type antimicrobial peptide transport system permease subunit
MDKPKLQTDHLGQRLCMFVFLVGLALALITSTIQMWQFYHGPITLVLCVLASTVNLFLGGGLLVASPIAFLKPWDSKRWE